MLRRIPFLLLLLSFSLIASAKGRAVGPGARDCTYGVIDRPEWANQLAIDETDVYYFDDFAATLNRVSKNGGSRTELAYLPTFLVFDVFVDDRNVYLATVPAEFDDTLLPGSILAIPKTGGVYTTLASGVSYPTQIAADATHVYWVALGTVHFFGGSIEADGKIERILKNGSGRQTLAASLSAPVSIALDSDRLYFSETGIAEGNSSKGIRSLPKSGGPVVKIENQYLAADLAISGDDILYYTEVDAETPAIGFRRVAKSGGPSSWFVEDDDIGSGPKVFEGWVYYAKAHDDIDTTLMRVPASGGTPQLLGITHMTDFEFEIDVCGIYYGTYDETLVRSPR